ncbi:hypothetical protein MKK88_20540 [Methylobacterium sp. E-005]|uniref:hypothetical protein n=1 Tax=Methylobacterium sp. E-005 TaxID=2836549 RepID=UPI001FB9B0DE|nr:hypothetical protein [Methylobacterium sp. E-005]MCJ2088355.1 hypothetical protein [Methylobacterium sp. E-005]
MSHCHDRVVRFGDALNNASALQAVRYHLRCICDAAIAAPFNPEHVAAVKRETLHCGRQMRGAPAAEAAE